MAASFRNYLGKFALLAVIALLASCSNADKNADKSIEQKKDKMEQSLDVKEKSDEKAHKDSMFKVSIDSVIKAIEKVSTRGMTPLYGVGRVKCVAQAPIYEELSVASDVDADKVLILNTIRQRTPGLRHIYNKHLKKNRVKACLKNNHDDIKPDFNGMIVFKLNVNADGSVQKAEIQSSNTGNKDFDDEVKRALNRWKYPKLKSSEVVTFPITFFEKSTPFKLTTYPEILF